MGTLVFAVVALLFIIADLVVVFLALMQRSREGRLLAAAMSMAAIVCVGYTVSVTAFDYFAMSVASSIHFSGVDLSLFFLVLYLFSFTGLWDSKAAHTVKRILGVIIAIDVCSLMANPFFEHALHYAYDPTSIAHWRYVVLWPYEAHLLVCYSMVVTAFVVLIRKSRMVPRVYRGRYAIVGMLLLFTVLVNAVFLFVPRTLVLDYSLMFYSVVGFTLYFLHFRYSGKSMLSATREMILDQLGRAVVLFDYEGRFTTCNEDANKFIPAEARQRKAGSYFIDQFIDDLGVRGKIPSMDEDCSFHHHVKVGSLLLPYRFDFHVLKDAKGRLLGHLFILCDNSSEIDLLTGFHAKNAFEREYSTRAVNGISYPVQVCVCDLNHLADLNNLKGRDAGDDAISLLADLMVECLPLGTYFARHDDALLLAVCENQDIQVVKDALNKIRSKLHEQSAESFPLDMQSAIGSATEEEPRVLDAAAAAISALRARKMLDVDSAHSSLLSSLSMALRQTDGDTNEHVARTRIMAEGLADRLGLSDWQKSSLALLCLLHDIGKIGIPLEILNKPGKLSDAEWEMMKSHTLKGYEIAMASDELRGVADFVLHHHECWDGSGYPDGLTKEAIPLLSRIVAVVDAFDAMTHDRPYRRAIPMEEALAELKRCAGVQFDPTIVAEFSEMAASGMFGQGDYKALPEDEAQKPLSAQSFPARSIMDSDDSESGLRPRLHAYRYGEFEPTGIYPVRYSKYILDNDQVIVSVFGDFEEMTGYSWDEVQSYRLSQNDLLFPDDRESYWSQAAEQLERNHEAYIDHRVRRKDGSTLKVFCYGRQYFDSAERKHKNEIVIADLDSAGSLRHARKSARTSALRGLKRWEDRARRDAVTGLLNREAFMNDVQMHLLKDDAVAVLMMLDVDHFKTFNDTYGHPEGDALLIAVAHALEEAVDDAGIACRMGGDEFAAILFFDLDIPSEEILEAARGVWGKVLASAQQLSKDVTVSAGAARVDEEAKTFHALYALADEQLYRAKREGRNRFYHNWE